MFAATEYAALRSCELESFEPGKRVDGELVDADEHVVGALRGDERVMSEVKHAAGRTTFVPNA